MQKTKKQLNEENARLKDLVDEKNISIKALESKIEVLKNKYHTFSEEQEAKIDINQEIHSNKMMEKREEIFNLEKAIVRMAVNNK